MLIRSVFEVPRLFHFTDVRNLPSIREFGGLLSLYELKKNGLQPIAPSGNEWSHNADRISGMDRFVHLCFWSAHPMEYVARREGRIGKSCFLEIDPRILRLDGVKFTREVSNKSGITPKDLAEADQEIDFEVLYSPTNWRDPLIQKRLKLTQKYEILIPNMVSLSLIRNMPDG